MKKHSSKPFWQAVGLGAAAGMRTTAAPVIVNQMLNNRKGKLNGSPLKFMQSGTLGVVLKVLAGGELIGDKLPMTPNRTEPLGVVFRCLSGALSASCIYEANGKSAIGGAMLGFTAALGSTFGCYLLRKAVVKQTDIGDPWIGGLEDALVAGTAFALIKSGL